MSIYVVIVNWNGRSDTIRCLESLLKAEALEFRIVVCDNASSDGSLAALTEWGAAHFGTAMRRLRIDDIQTAPPPLHAERFFLIDNAGNLGFAGGNNSGLSWALRDIACSHVWLLNNDTEVRPGAISHVLRRMDADPSIGICGSTLVYDHDRRTIQAFGGSTYSAWTGRTRHLGAFSTLDDLTADPALVESRMACVTGAAMMVKRELLETVGLLEDSYFLYFEEIDWATRAKGRFRLGYAPLSVVFHKEGASIGTSASGGSQLSVYYLFRNRIRYAWRFHRPFLPFVLAFAIGDVVKLVLRSRRPLAVAAVRGALQLSRPVASAQR